MKPKYIILIAIFGVIALATYYLLSNFISDSPKQASQVSETEMTENISDITDAAVELDAFPVTFEHKFGVTTIDHQPQRVATLDWTGADDLLALDVQPVSVRDWLCTDQPYSVCPWAQQLLKSEPTVIGRQIEYEALAATKPDIIIAVWSGITAQDYNQLSKIAPVVATPKGVGDYALTWKERTILTGKAVGRESLAKAKVAEVEDKLTAAAKPEWQGKTAAIGFFNDSSFGAITANDPSMQLLGELGFTLPPSLIKDASNIDFLPLSSEEINRLDADLLIWANTGNDEHIKKLPGRNLLKAHQSGHELFLEKNVNNAFRQATVLSIPYVTENLVPIIDSTLSDE